MITIEMAREMQTSSSFPSSCSPQNVRFRIYYLFGTETRMKRPTATQNERFLDQQLLERHRKEVRREQIRFFTTVSIVILTVTLFLIIFWFICFTFLVTCDDNFQIPILTENLNNSSFAYVADETLPSRILSNSLGSIFYRWKCPFYPAYYIDV